MIWCHLPTAKDDLQTFSCCFVTLITTLAFTPQRIFKVQKNTRALFWVELRCTTIYGITFLFLRLESVPKILILKLCGLLSECVWMQSAEPLPEPSPGRASADSCRAAPRRAGAGPAASADQPGRPHRAGKLTAPERHVYSWVCVAVDSLVFLTLNQLVMPNYLFCSTQ